MRRSYGADLSVFQPVELIVAAAVDEVVLKDHLAPVILLHFAALDQVARDPDHVAVGAVEGTVLVSDGEGTLHDVQQARRIPFGSAVEGENVAAAGGLKLRGDKLKVASPAEGCSLKLEQTRKP